MKRLLLLVFVISVALASIKGSEPLKPGDSAADFRLKSVTGQSVALSDLNDASGFIVVFSCNTCPVVKKYEQRIIDLHDNFSAKGYPVIAVNSNDVTVSPGDSYEEMKKLAASKGYRFNYLYDESQEVARKYGATNTPHVYVLSKKDGSLFVEYAGAIDNNADDASKADKKYVEDAVNSLLNNKQVPVNSTKAVGCGVKWKRS